MATEVPPTQPKAQSSAELEDLDRVLHEMDPKFAQELDAMKKVEPTTDVNIESAMVGDEFSGTDDGPLAEEPKKSWLPKLQIRARVTAWARRTFVWLLLIATTVPKEFALYVLAILKRFGLLLRSFGKLTRSQKLATLVLAALGFLMFSLIRANLHGSWLPSLYPPILTEFGSHADATFDFDPGKDMIPFFKAFPQDPEIFLFQKVKVNLRRSPDHPLPMGAFEIYAQLDSHDTAIEVQTRQVELQDMIQRVIEGQSYEELVSDLGKNRLKGLLKKEIDHALTQGWVTDIHYKTFVLKP